MNDSLENLKKRLSYYGVSKRDRIENGKLRTLRMVLRDRSYQTETILTQEDKSFKCLINPNRLSEDYDNKIISIPFEDIDLNASIVGKTVENRVATGLKVGSTFLWKENNTHWLIYLQDLEESSYFRGHIRKCTQEIDIQGKKYWCAFKDISETEIKWHTKKNITWNDLSMVKVMYITKDEHSNSNIKRFMKIKAKGSSMDTELKTWQVGGINHGYGEGLLAVYLQEYYENDYEKVENELPIQEANETIEGPASVFVYDKVTYSSSADQTGKWFYLDEDEETFLGEGKQVAFTVMRKQGAFKIKFEAAGELPAVKEIQVKRI